MKIQKVIKKIRSKESLFNILAHEICSYNSSGNKHYTMLYILCKFNFTFMIKKS